MGKDPEKSVCLFAYAARARPVRCPCGTEAVRFLHAYGAKGLDLTHLEYARLARSLRDIAVRIVNDVDLEGINTGGFDGLRRVDADLALARTFCDR